MAVDVNVTQNRKTIVTTNADPVAGATAQDAAVLTAQQTLQQTPPADVFDPATFQVALSDMQMLYNGATYVFATQLMWTSNPAK